MFDLVLNPGSPETLPGDPENLIMSEYLAHKHDFWWRLHQSPEAERLCKAAEDSQKRQEEANKEHEMEEPTKRLKKILRNTETPEIQRSLQMVSSNPGMLLKLSIDKH